LRRSIANWRVDGYYFSQGFFQGFGSSWDIHAAHRSGILSVGLLSGGFGEQELYNAGAMRVYKDAQGLFDRIDELGLDS
jgi:hypothetical protein